MALLRQKLHLPNILARGVLTGRGLLFSLMNSPRTVLHVVKDRPADMWEVLPENSGKPISHHRTQETAIKAATAAAKRATLGQVKIHREDTNKIRKEYTYGKDPRKYRG